MAIAIKRGNKAAVRNARKEERKITLFSGKNSVTLKITIRTYEDSRKAT